MTTLTPSEARRLYDRVGRGQDRHAFYEDPATERLVELANLSEARAVFEFGCGTGRFARRLLDEHLPRAATYRGVDLSPTMVELARRRLQPYGSRYRVDLSDGRSPVDEPSGAYDRFVSSFVFDLLPEESIRAVVEQAHRMLRADGLLAVCGLCHGTGPASRLVASAIGRVQARHPALVGGCRPIDLTPFLEASKWETITEGTIVSWAVPSQIVVARPVE